MPLKKAFHYLLPVEIITIAYLTVTGLFLIAVYPKIDNAFYHLLFRIATIGSIFAFYYYEKKHPKPWLKFLRSFYILALLGFFYAETDAFNNVFLPNLDHTFANFENFLFKGQPSILFYNTFPYKWFNELMSFSYFCYYPIIFTLCYYVYIKNNPAFNKVIFVICTSFYLYYIVFMLLPVAGPQYFFAAPFNHNPQVYLFSKLMGLINCMAERPTAAFPSSHVGIICIIWILSFRYAPTLLKIIIPIGILLFLSTVYIKAHYLIDVFGGIISAPIFYWLSLYLFKKISPANS
jgi:membrane-associated phospholipid phosphatase